MKSGCTAAAGPTITGMPPESQRGERDVHVGGAEPEAQALLDDRATRPRSAAGSRAAGRTGSGSRRARARARPPPPPGTTRAARPGSSSRRRSGRCAREPVLHDEGGVGAERHQLAVGHVDDAHQPEDDGEAERHQQQDRRERRALEDRLDASGQQVPALDALDRDAAPPCRSRRRGAGVRREPLERRQRVRRVQRRRASRPRPPRAAGSPARRRISASASSRRGAPSGRAPWPSAASTTGAARGVRPGCRA